mmetsp:Transcript_2985/g.5511  ORF Transcript_2985/g.5511 Transcript_2985/m.5511 type:complete len:225 (-) Transcript_2985:109-783(-)
MSHLIQLIGSSKSRRTRTYNSYRHAGTFLGNTRSNESLFPSAVDNGVFNILDGNGTIDESCDTRTLTGCRADTSREFRKVIRLVQTINGFSPLTIVDKIVPLWNQIVHRTTSVRLTKGSATVHTTSRLNLEFDIRVMDLMFGGRIQFAPIHNALKRWTVWLWVPFIVEKPTKLFNTLISTISSLDFWLIVMIVYVFTPDFMPSICSNRTFRSLFHLCTLTTNCL